MPASPATIDIFSDVSRQSSALAKKDKGLGRAVAAIGAPHIRRRPGGFEGLFRIIVEQQVSVPSAQAIWKRCADKFDCTSTAALARVGETGLKQMGLSTPKARYVVGLAAAIDGGLFDPVKISKLDDQAAAAALTSIRGVGPWTAAIYLLFCEGRVDIWPRNDVALKHAYNAAAKVGFSQSQLDAAAAGWTPWRGVAAHILWTYYAHLRGRAPI